MLEEQLIRDLNSTLTDLKEDIGAVKSTLKQNERTFENINRQITELNENNITIARATGFVGGISFITSTVTAVTLHYLKIIRGVSPIMPDIKIRSKLPFRIIKGSGR